MTKLKPARNEFEDLGERLVRFGKALQDSTTSVGRLNQLAVSAVSRCACGL